MDIDIPMLDAYGVDAHRGAKNNMLDDNCTFSFTAIQPTILEPPSNIVIQLDQLSLVKEAPALASTNAVRGGQGATSPSNPFEHPQLRVADPTRIMDDSSTTRRDRERGRLQALYPTRALYPDSWRPSDIDFSPEPDYSRRDQSRDRHRVSRARDFEENTSMGDRYQAQGDRYRGGGKRRRDIEDGGDHYRPDGRRAQRPRYREEPHEAMRRMVLNIANTAKEIEKEAIEIAEYLRDHYDYEEVHDAFFDTFVQLLIEQPLKIPFAAAVAFFGNQLKPEITVEVMKRVGDELQQAFNAGHWTVFKLCLRFFACLQSLFEDEGIFAFLGQLFDTVVDLQSANENDVVGIELVKIILLTIPYAIASGGSESHDKAQELLAKTEIVAGNMLPMEALIHCYDEESEDKVIGYHSIIGLLQQQLTKESESGWNLACIPKFDPDAIKKRDDDDTLTTVPPTHAFPTFTIPSPVNPGPTPLFPEAYISLFANLENTTVPKTDDIAASIIRDAIVDSIDQLDFNREAAAKILIEIDSYWTKGTFAFRGTPFDKFRDVVGDQLMYKPEDMVIDAIFSQLFKLPAPAHKLVYYHSLITSCCKLAPQAIAPSLGRAIRTVYQSLHVMDLELTYRFLDWFTHHLSNFEFRWRWTEWIGDLDLSNLQPKKAFIIAALDKEIRLSFAKRIRSTLPSEMNDLIPARLDEDNSPEFKYDNPDTPYSEQGKELKAQLKKKKSTEEVQETIDKIHELAAEQGVTDVLIPSTDAFVTSICSLGSKSLTHVLGYIERGKDRLISIAQTSESARRQIVASVYEYWRDQPGVAVRIIDFLLNYTVLTPMTVVQWTLEDNLGAGEGLAENWIYEIVSITMAKVASRNRQIVDSRVVKDLPQDVVHMVEATLSKDREAARELYKYLEDVLRGIAEGSSDRLIEAETSGKVSKEDGELIRAWAKRWHTVFIRKSAIEESVVGEQAVEARIKFLLAESAHEPDAMDAEDANGVKQEMSINGD